VQVSSTIHLPQVCWKTDLTRSPRVKAFTDAPRRPCYLFSNAVRLSPLPVID
jgi:hypothetical protein